ncbi:serum amyloid P-component-like [Engraulis encrasicolus]|uniref:serum amyloid P-component-like n=1 Tax=Engraulis encrasicolus TaxID=184585 RepID=UPI002FCEFD40
MSGIMRAFTFLLVHSMSTLADKQDLSGKMFTFPVQTDKAHVILVPNQSKTLTAVTVCLRFFSDQSRAQSLFSFATPTNPNALLLFKRENSVYEVDQGNQDTVLFWGLEDKRNEWNSLCATWNSATGITQLWVNGKSSVRKGLRRGGDISGVPSVILGQDQDTYGGKFDRGQSFTGMVTDLHMWDSVLPYPEIALYMNHIPLKNDGNVISWKSLEYTAKDYVLVEDMESYL